MSKILMLAAAALALGTALPAVAGDSEPRCPAAAAGRLPSPDAIRAELESAGYRVDKVELDDGCYEFKVVNDSGYPVKATYEPGTGELLRAELD